MALPNKIAIIGGGASGLVAARYLNSEAIFKEVVIFEQHNNIGGIWKLNSAVQYDFSTPVYEGLEANIPRSMMQFSQLEYPDSTPLFPSQSDVRKYLQQYAQDSQLLIKLNHRIRNVSHSIVDSRVIWNIEGEDMMGRHSFWNTFDGLIVATGHHDVPYFPEIVGLEEWRSKRPETVLHSKCFKTPSIFSGKKTLIVGLSASGLDIAKKICAVCEIPLYISQRTKSTYYEAVPNAVELVELKSVNWKDRSATFVDGGSIKELDYLFFCTGYTYSFPFLDNYVGVNIYMPPHLYQHIFDPYHPTLAFVGLLDKVTPFPIAEAQAAVIAKVWSGKIQLPSLDIMKEWIVTAFPLHDPRRMLRLSYPQDVDYMNDMIDWAKNVNEGSREGRTENHLPERWGEVDRWKRQQIPVAKRMFQAVVGGKSDIKTLEDLGFSFDSHNQDQ